MQATSSDIVNNPQPINAGQMNGTLDTSPPSFDVGAVESLLQQFYDVKGEAKLLVSERDQNFRISVGGRPRYLLKIANTAELRESIDYENAALEHLRAVAPQLPIPRIIKAIDGSSIVQAGCSQERTHIVRLITWMDGRMLREVEPTESLRRELGAKLAELGRGLRGFIHPAADKSLLWDITRVAELAELAQYVEDNQLREFCTAFINRFADAVSPRLLPLRSQVIYNDMNPSNILVTADGSPSVSGIVDFGDMVHAPLVCDVAVAAAYQLAEGDEPLETVPGFVAAYHRVTPLEPAELEVLFDLIIARLVVTVVIAGWRAQQYPENREYILRNAHAAARNIKKLGAVDSGEVYRRLLQACPELPVAAAAAHKTVGDTETLVQSRKNLLGSAYRLFYERPVHMVRGEDVWLYDADGRAYLDAYNNVPLVGHCHPYVVRAMSEQAAKLNSHTRYLHEGVLEYAERLLALFPGELNRVMFGCTGSEANELALRIAHACTGNRGVIATRFAYHGNTRAIAQLSPSYMSAEKREDWAEIIPPPDTYRCGDGAEDATRDKFLKGIDDAIERLAGRGIKPAALILDAGFTSDGMFQPSPGTLAEAARRVRAAGGIYIADEVQSGFARFGETLWGFERDNLVPDIVTLGKPIGNGHPLAATIVRHDVLDAFSEKTRYFNTFGGNPVSAAVGLAVLDVFEQERLAENSLATGSELHNQLRALADTHDLIGDVRGSGLFAGVELVKDRATKQPAGDITGLIVNMMRERGVLISMIGPDGNVLKVRPPLPFQRRHVDQLVETLDACLSAIE